MTTPPLEQPATSLPDGAIVPYDFAQQAAQWAANAASQLAVSVSASAGPAATVAVTSAVESAARAPSVEQLEVQAFHSVVAHLLGELQGQPWWKKYSNTVMAVASGLVVLAGWVTTTGFGLPHWAQVTTGAILFAGSVFGIKSTKNGLTDSVLTSVLSAPGSPVAPQPGDGKHRAALQ